jgi:hypothetical protein
MSERQDLRQMLIDAGIVTPRGGEFVSHFALDGRPVLRLDDRGRREAAVVIANGGAGDQPKGLAIWHVEALERRQGTR